VDLRQGGESNPVNPKNILFQVLSTGSIKAELAIFFTVMAQRGAAVSLFLGHSGYMASDRNQGISEWLDQGDSEYLIQCDEDMVPPMNVLELASWEKDITSLVYLFAGQGGPTIAASGLNGNEPVFPILEGEERLIEVAWVGTGCYCIKRSAALKMIEKQGQVFLFDFIERGHKGRGCDVFMCRKAREHGLKVWLDRGLIAGHVKSATWAPDPSSAILTFQPWGSYWNGDKIPTRTQEIEPLSDLIGDVLPHVHERTGSGYLDKKNLSIRTPESSYKMPRLESVDDPSLTLRAGVEIMEKSGLKYWVAAGTALGFHRGDGFIAGDTDIDVEVLVDELFDVDLKKMFEGTRFVLIREVLDGELPAQLAFKDTANGGIIFDIYFFYEGIERGVAVNYNAGPVGKMVMDLSLLSAVEKREMAGVEAPFLVKLHEYVLLRYGKDWETPAKKKGLYNNDF